MILHTALQQNMNKTCEKLTDKLLRYNGTALYLVVGNQVSLILKIWENKSIDKIG